MKVVIIGGVAGGATAAARLRRLDECAEIVVIEKGGYVSFANCGLPYYIGGSIKKRDELLLQTPESFRDRFNVDVRVNHEVIAINSVAHTVSVRDLASGSHYEESFDRLILAPGASPNIPDLPGLDDPRVFTLRNIADTDAIKAFVVEKRPRRAVIVGGGYIGIEMAENLVDAGVAVSVIQRSDHVIKTLDVEMAGQVHQHLCEKGVDLRLQTPFSGVEAIPSGTVCGDGTESAASTGGHLNVLMGEDRLPCDMVILSIGVRPDSELASAANLEVDEHGGIIVDSHMRTSDPDIYAAGDAVVVSNLISGEPSLIPLAGPANKQGRIAADNICGIPSTYCGTQGSAVLKVFDLTVASTGLNERQARAAGIECDKVYLSPNNHAGYYPGGTAIMLKVLFAPGDGRILGAQAVGREGVDKRVDVLAVAIRAGMTARDLTELELCYAPPFSSAKDPVNMAGYLIENVLAGRVRQYYWDEVDELPRDGSVQLVDVRSPGEFKRSRLPGFVNIPVDELRDRVDELDPAKPVRLLCLSALRSYLAARILTQRGFTDVSHLAGGLRLYSSL
jgi:NADPH-dependent 2,4-dienoyl-CoA reductase/sulfur reductase-like enzyme/rhodanese-related sulfurtransferase